MKNIWIIIIGIRFSNFSVRNAIQNFKLVIKTKFWFLKFNFSWLRVKTLQVFNIICIIGDIIFWRLLYHMFYYYQNQSYIFHTESSLDAINSDRNLNLLNSYLFQESKNLLLNLDEEWGFVTSEVKVNQTSLIFPSYELTIDITTIVNTTQLSFNLEPRVINMFNSINLSIEQLNLDVVWSTQNSSELIKFNITFLREWWFIESKRS